MYVGEFQPKFYSKDVTINGNQVALSYSYGIVVNSTTGYSNSKKKKLAGKQKNAQIYDGYGRFYAMEHPEQELNGDVLTQLQNDSSLGGLYRQYDWCVQSGMTSEAEAIFTTITQQEGEEQSNRYFVESIKRNIATQGSLSSSDYNTLISIRDANPHYLLVQSIIKYFGGISFERVPFTTSGSNARKARPEIENKNTCEQSKLKIVPNPASKQTAIIFGKTQSGLLSIYSIDGKIVKKINVFAKESVNIDVSTLNKGIYILKFTGEHNGSLKYSKLIIQ